MNKISRGFIAGFIFLRFSSFALADNGSDNGGKDPAVHPFLQAPGQVSGATYCVWTPKGTMVPSRSGGPSDIPGKIIVADGASIVAYKERIGLKDSGDACASETRTCRNGLLSGSYAFATCEKLDAECHCPFTPATCPKGQKFGPFPLTPQLRDTPWARGPCYAACKTCVDDTSPGWK